ncbi:hypothetical protein E0493_17400 [Roseomonas sp. M0104]|uniref:Molecular chaperone DnaJ n=1 Tax=Teichococcus coralli TaxID=2545983 RepID=A0A845BDY0_9PROT|nr:hypothetical protein [Pseudoroseomonas coralli]MXP65125.1 hypothetical protein [Pseudoroseomonas coralli]
MRTPPNAGSPGSPGAGSEPLKPGDDAPPGTPATGQDLCPDCEGRGKVNGHVCATCQGTGTVNKGIGGA